MVSGNSLRKPQQRVLKTNVDGKVLQVRIVSHFWRLMIATSRKKVDVDVFLPLPRHPQVEFSQACRLIKSINGFSYCHIFNLESGKFLEELSQSRLMAGKA